MFRDFYSIGFAVRHKMAQGSNWKVDQNMCKTSRYDIFGSAECKKTSYIEDVAFLKGIFDIFR